MAARHLCLSLLLFSCTLHTCACNIKRKQEKTGENTHKTLFLYFVFGDCNTITSATNCWRLIHVFPFFFLSFLFYYHFCKFVWRWCIYLCEYDFYTDHKSIDEKAERTYIHTWHILLEYRENVWLFKYTMSKKYQHKRYHMNFILVTYREEVIHLNCKSKRKVCSVRKIW